MVILEKPITKEELTNLSQNYFVDMIKAVVDVDRELIALDAELHSDLEAFLIENGSSQESLWGFNLYPEADNSDVENFVEFDSLINIRPRQGNKSRYVEDSVTRERIISIVNKFITK
jgi:hypothetical protein